jgi:AMP deaminase
VHLSTHSRTQVGLSVSPLSNNTLFVPLSDNPFPDFFKYGMNVTLSTDDPLQFHSTAEPLIEEYTVCKQLMKLSGTDLAEIARNRCVFGSFGFLCCCWMNRDPYVFQFVRFEFHFHSS